MARSNVFDLDESDSLAESRVRPLWTLDDLDKDETVLKWANETYLAELKRGLAFREQALRHIALFKGRFYPDRSANPRSQFAEASTAGLGVVPTKPNKLVVNHLYDLTQQRVSRAMRTKPGVQIMPANAEYSDRVSAKIVKFWVDYLMYQNNFDDIVARICRAAFIMGEAYIWVRWNPNLGDVQPDWKDEEAQARRDNRPPRLIKRDDEGNPVIGRDGEPLYVEKAPKVGDVEFKVLTPLNTLVQLTGEFQAAEYFIYEEYQDLDEVKALYPNVADLIDEQKNEDVDDAIARWRQLAGVKNGPQEGKILVRYLYHRPTDFLASGRMIVCTRTAMLENKPLQPGQEGLSLVRLTDIDVPGEQRGASFYTQGKALNATINDLTSMQRRNMILLAHPKWTVPRGSLIKKDALGNDITVVEYQGAVEPKIQVPPPMNSEAMSMKADLKQDLQMILGTFDVSRGQIPANVRSAAALQALYEQEDMRASAQNVKQATLIRETIQAAINLAACYYEKDDKRLLPVVGRDNRYLLKEFDPVHLTKSYDIRVSNDTGMPSSAAVRFDMVMRLKETMPNYMTDERAAEILRFGDDERLLDQATLAAQAAEAENEAMLSMETVDEPADYEDHIVHWTRHMRETQNRGFKTATPSDVQARFILHLMATERLMLEAARKNPRYAVELTKIPQFPVFYDISPEDRMILDYARTGNPLSLEQMAVLDEMGVQGMAAMGGGMVPPPGGFNAQTNNTVAQQEGNPGSMQEPQEEPQQAPGAPTTQRPGNSNAASK